MKTSVLAFLLAAFLVAPVFADDSRPAAFRIAIEATVPDEDLRDRIAIYRNQFLSVSGPSEADLIETVTNSITKLNIHILEPERKSNQR